jgi:caspase domain-containing protein/putative peptidoglycan binding protein
MRDAHHSAGVERDLPSRGPTHVLAIGIDAYVHHRKLHNCVRDVGDLVQCLTHTYEVEASNVTWLLDHDATRSKILIALDGYGKLSETESLIVLYAGHGIIRNGIGAWLPADAAHFYDHLHLSMLHDLLEPIRARHILIIADACFPDRLFAATRSGEISERLEALPSRYALTSGRDGPVLDGPEGENSPFAEALKRRLATSNGSIGIVMLSEQVREDVEGRTDRAQIPRHDYLHVRGNQHGQFFFRRRSDAMRVQDLFVQRYRDRGGGLIPPCERRRMVANQGRRLNLFLESQSNVASRELRRGNTTEYLAECGLDIQTLKDRLARLGVYDGAIDDVYGEDLAESLAQFQDSQMMRQVDGFFGELTYREIVHALIERGLASW